MSITDSSMSVNKTDGSGKVVLPAPRRRLRDIGVPNTDLLDSTVVKSKAEAVKQSQVYTYIYT